jgi:predicted anti-sigma-YlaC factor YlaD
MRLSPALLGLFVLVSLPACSVKRYAIDRVGDALASGQSTYASDGDLDLVGEALPFSVKLVESLLAESPDHRGLLITASQGFTLYSYGYVHFAAERLAQDDLTRARALGARAKKLYLRAHRYAMRGLELSYPGFERELHAQPAQAVQRIGRDADGRNMPLLYWAAASLGLAVSADRQDAALLARLAEVDALIARALALDESWNAGVLHEFALSFLAARPGVIDQPGMERHFARAQELAAGKRANVYVCGAEALAVRRQDRAQFERLLGQALAVDLEADPANRLANALAQRRARWLLARADELFLE